MKILVKNVHVFDGTRNELTESSNIVVEDNLVSDVVQDPVSDGGFDDVIDGRGFWAILLRRDDATESGKARVQPVGASRPTARRSPSDCETGLHD